MSAHDEHGSELPPKPAGRRRGLLVGAVVLAVLLALAAVYAVSRSGSDTAAGRTTVRIGATDASKPYWTTFKQLAAERGIDLEPVNFSEYTQPNAALSQGQIDLNLFQHLQFLADYNVSNEDTLTPVGSTYVVPLSLYSQRHHDLAALPRGGKVAIPNDATNQARALLVLQQAGLVELIGGGNSLSTPAELDTARSKVSVVPVDAAQTVASLPSVDAAVVNNNYASDAGLDPSKALFGDDPASPAAEPYVNVIVARAADRENPVYRDIVSIYQDERVAGQVRADSKGTAHLVRKPAEELRAVLAGLESTVRAGGK